MKMKILLQNQTNDNSKDIYQVQWQEQSSSQSEKRQKNRRRDSETGEHLGR